ncbi:hypothetical protein BM527_00475 [Alteromonas sp. Mex14]|nr:hypothetical protein BM527_00475 [Alteromonas sp. Mex14]
MDIRVTTASSAALDAGNWLSTYSYLTRTFVVILTLCSGVLFAITVLGKNTRTKPNDREESLTKDILLELLSHQVSQLYRAH